MVSKQNREETHHQGSFIFSKMVTLERIWLLFLVDVDQTPRMTTLNPVADSMIKGQTGDAGSSKATGYTIQLELILPP